MSARSSRDRHGSSSREDRDYSGRSRGRSGDENPELKGSDSNDGLFLGFEHRMNTDQRRRMRERERAEAKDSERGRNQSGSPSSVPRGTSYTSSMRSTSGSTYSRYTSRTSDRMNASSHDTKSTSRRSTAYSRELEKRERARDRRREPMRSSSSADSVGTARSAGDHSPVATTLRSTQSDQHPPSSRHRRNRSSSPSHDDRSRGSRSERSRRGKSRDRSPVSYTRRRSGSPNHYRLASSRSRDEDRERRREERRARDREERRARREAERAAAAGGSTAVDSLRPSRQPEKDDDASADRPSRSAYKESGTRKMRSRSRDIDKIEVDDEKGEKPSEPAGEESQPKHSIFDKSALTTGTETPSFIRARNKFESAPSNTQALVRERLRTRMLGNDLDERSKKERVAAADESRSLKFASRGANSSSNLSAGSKEKSSTELKGVTAESSDSDYSDEDVEEDDPESSDEDDEESWTVRVCLIKAVDLHNNAASTTPLCPVLKFGLVRIPEDEVDSLTAESSADGATGQGKDPLKSSISKKIESDGLTSFPRARVRCTSTKILSNRDKGEMEFHEEMRWDKVKRPTMTALAVELCARAALPPPNYYESPLLPATDCEPAAEPSYGSGAPLPSSFSREKWTNQTNKNYLDDDLYKKALGKRAAAVAGPTAPAPAPTANDKFGLNNFVNRYNTQQQQHQQDAPSSANQAATDEGQDAEEHHAPAVGIAGMRALFRRRTPWQQANRAAASGTDDSAAAASAVARFLIGGSNDNSTEANASGNGEPAVPNLRSESPTVTEKKTDTTDGQLASAIGAPTSGVKRALPQPQPQADENVALQKSKKRRKVEMTKGLRLGSLVIPLTRLPLAKATCGNEAARIESWYQLDPTSNALSPVESPRSRALATATKLTAARRTNPSILLEISFSAPHVLDESEDDLEVESDGEGEATMANDDTMEEQGGWGDDSSARADNKSFARRTSSEMRVANRAAKVVAAGVADEEKRKPEEKKKRLEDPVLEPGVVDFVAVVGAGNIGDQQGDDGSKGWVTTNPECTILEQFPPSDEFHLKQGRNVTLQNKAEWFCFPEGCRLWRGAEPPTHTDLNLKRFSASSPPNVASSIAAFDACMNCTTSFSWFVIQSNEKENNFKNLRTYGAVIKFYAPAPPGIDRTQDDYAQNFMTSSGDRQDRRKQNQASAKRLWVPLGILMTSNLPVVGTLEAMLLRLCESLAQRTGGSVQSTSRKRLQQIISQDLANLVINFQKPIPGVLHCSIPFLTGDRLHLTVPPPTGLPPLPHGGSVTSVCKLLGSDGLNDILAAVLTECKVLIHSDEVSNLPMVSEVVTALIYPFVWSLPYLPVVPDAMLEIVEAPLSFFIGMPTCNMKLMSDEQLTDIVVIDLDNTYTSPDYYDGRRGGRQTKAPTPLPASVASNISKAVFRLLREEEEVEEEYGANNFPGSRSLPRLEDESQAEREFRIAVALQVCGLVRGYDDCLFKVSASQPVFNREKFLRTAPALFEDRRGNLANSGGGGGQQRMLSPRSKRFLSQLVSCQHFHQFLESLDLDECAFFNEVMYTFDMNDDSREEHFSNQLMGYGSSKLEEAASHLSKALQKVEDKIPTYRVDRKGKKKRRAGGLDDDDDDEGGFDGMIDVGDNDIGFSDDGNLISSFTSELLQQVTAEPKSEASPPEDIDDTLSVESMHSGEARAIDVDMLQQLDKSPWRYSPLFEIPITDTDGGRPLAEIREKVKLRDAIGERRYRAWKVAQEQKLVASDTSGRMFTGDLASAETNTALDLTSLLSQVTDDTASDTTSTSGTVSSSGQSRKASTLSPEQQRVADARDRDVLRRCLERAYEGGNQRRPARFGRRPSLNHSSQPAQPDKFIEKGRDLIADAEAALRNPSAQKFLVSVLSQRSRLESQRKRRHGNDDTKGRRQAKQSTVSRLEPPAFECLVRLCGAMLDACMETKNYESGYSLLIHTQGFCTVQTKDGKPVSKKDSDFGPEQGTKVVYMTARISLHPIFAELELWEHVLKIHLNDRENDKSVDQSTETKGATGTKTNADTAAYETTVSTLWEMHGYGIPAEELARFATRVSEQRGWFSTERGHSLLMLARRLSVKRENGDDGTGTAGDLDMMRSGKAQAVQSVRNETEVGEGVGSIDEDPNKFEWAEIGWCHPAAAGFSRPTMQALTHGTEGGGTRTSQNLLSMIGTDGQSKEAKIDDSKYLKRSAVTSLAAFGSSIIASGGLDGSVFVAHTVSFASNNKENENLVKGVRLDWGSSGRSANKDGEYGVGAVSCLAAAKGAGYRGSLLTSAAGQSKGITDSPDEDDMLQAMEGCRVVAGTTGGDLRVWSVKDVYAATVLAKGDGSSDPSKLMGDTRVTHGADGASSSYLDRPRRHGSITAIAAGSAKVRLKYSLRGRQLSGHRGGVSCIDVPSHIYRPDSLVTGGADGFIKLWSLRAPTGRRSSDAIGVGASSSLFNASGLGNGAGASDGQRENRARGLRGNDALSILSGHTGRILCVKTAWHGDRLLSGGADCTVKIWDLASNSAGKCLHSLAGHLGWVTHAHYWGPNTIVSASTDRAIALWDARVRRSPLFVLRHHQSPVSDLLVGSRTDPLMVSAAGDGTVATWDFRTLSGSDGDNKNSPSVTKSNDGTKGDKKCRAIRSPSTTIAHSAEGKGVRQAGAVLLSRGTGVHQRTVITVGADAVTREWEIATGRLVRQESTGHCDVISSLYTFSDGSMGTSSGVEPDASSNFGGTITSSWDGTVRMKKLVRR